MDKFVRHPLEFISALGVIGWGAWLLNPFVNSFEQFTSYAELAKIAPENVWGIVAVTSGVVILIGLWIENKPMRMIGLFGVIFFRTFLFVFVGKQTNFAASGVPDFALWTLIAIYAYWQAEHSG